MKKKNQKGISLLEAILSLALLGILFTILTHYLYEKAKQTKLNSIANNIQSVGDNVSDYVKEHFTELYNADEALYEAISINLLSEIYTNKTDGKTYNLGDLTTDDDNEYLATFRKGRVNGNTPDEEIALQVVVYYIDKKEALSYANAINVAQMIPNNQGAVLYFSQDESNSVLNPCNIPGFCLKNPYGSFEFNNLELATTLGPNTYNDFTSDEDVKGVAVVYNITSSMAGSEFLSTQENLTNRFANTLETDININDFAPDLDVINGGISRQNRHSIFFNAELEDVADAGGTIYQDLMKGSSLSFYQTDSFLTGNLNPDGTPEVEIVDNAKLLIENNRDGETTSFTANEGLKTMKQAITNDDCDEAIFKNILAVDETDGSILACQNSEWKPVNSKTSSFVLLSIPVEIATGNINQPQTVLPASIIPDDDLRENVTGLLLQTNFARNNNIFDFVRETITIESLGGTYTMVSGDDEFSYENVNVLVPYDNNSIIVRHSSSGIPTDTWDLTLIGYVEQR